MSDDKTHITVPLPEPEVLVTGAKSTEHVPLIDKEELKERMAHMSSTNRVTREKVETGVRRCEYMENARTGLTICVITMLNGFVVTGESKPVDPTNYDQSIGRRISYDKAISKLFELEGYLLADKLHTEHMAQFKKPPTRDGIFAKDDYPGVIYGPNPTPFFLAGFADPTDVLVYNRVTVGKDGSTLGRVRYILWDEPGGFVLSGSVPTDTPVEFNNYRREEAEEIETAIYRFQSMQLYKTPKSD